MGAWRRVPGTPTQQGYLGLALVVGTGLATALFALSHASQTAFGPREGVYVFTPVIVSIGLIVTGALLWTNSFDGLEMVRVGCGVFLGMAVFGLLVTWTITHELIRGESFAHAPFVTVNSMSIGGFVGLTLAWLDARNRRYKAKLERERNKLKQQTEELDEFASIVSHDLRNPLNVASLELQTAANTEDVDTRVESHTEIERSLDRMERIIDDVLTMAREGKAVGELESVDLEEVATYSWQNVETGTATLQIVDSTTLMADRGALEHVFENLFRNSLEHGSPDSGSQLSWDATARGSEDTQSGLAKNQGQPVIEDGGAAISLTVRVGTLDGGFYVEDDGRGIPAEARGQLFESGVTTNDDGTGFGLSIVEKLVTAHGWTVRATESGDGDVSEEQSESEAQETRSSSGARFEITGVEYTAKSNQDSWLADLD